MINFKNIKRDIYFFYHSFSVPNTLIISILILTILLLTFGHISQVYFFTFPPNRFFDFLYNTFDPEILTLLSSFIVFSLYIYSYSNNLYFYTIKKISFQRILISFFITVVFLGCVTGSRSSTIQSASCRAVISPLLGEKNTVQRCTRPCSATIALAQS